MRSHLLRVGLGAVVGFGTFGLLVALAAPLVVVGGCTESRPGVTKESGSYVRYLSATPDKVGPAARQALLNLGFTVIDESNAGRDRKVVARNTQDTRITVTASPDGPAASKVGVNVDPGEDEGLSLRVLDQVQQQLGM